MKQSNFFIFINKILYSSFFLWILLLFLKIFNLKPEINIILFFLLSFLLFLIIFFRQILFFIISNLNKLNYYLNLTKEKVEINSHEASFIIPFFIRESLIFFKGFPVFLKFVLYNDYFWFLLCIFGIFLNIFVFKFTSDLLIIILTGLLILSAYRLKFNERPFIFLSLSLLFLCPFLLIFKKELMAEKAALWVYIFLALGLGQMIIRYIREERGNVNKKK
jgi:hypothetical protein